VLPLALSLAQCINVVLKKFILSCFCTTLHINMIHIYILHEIFYDQTVYSIISACKMTKDSLSVLQFEAAIYARENSEKIHFFLDE
jgi:hypothetical protein